MPNKSGKCYSRAINYMVDVLPQTANYKTIVVDRSLAQYNAFSERLPNARIVFCRFHMLKDMEKKCSHLAGLAISEKQCLFH